MEQLVFCSQRQVAHEAGAFLNERLLADVEKGSPSKKKGTSIINMILRHKYNHGPHYLNLVARAFPALPKPRGMP